MTFEEHQKCLDTLGVSVELQFQYPDGHTLSSHESHEQLIDRMGILEKIVMYEVVKTIARSLDR